MMNYLYKNNYKTIGTKEFYKWYIGEIEFYRKTIMITFDDGQYEDYYLVYPIIKRYNMKSISFLIGNNIANITNEYNKFRTSYIGIDIIHKIRIEYPNFEFQSHSYNMHSKINKTAKVLLMNYEELEKDFIMNKKFNFSFMAYPYGEFNINIKYFLNKYNYTAAFSFGHSRYSTRKDEKFSIPRITLHDYANVNLLKKWLKKIS